MYIIPWNWEHFLFACIIDMEAHSYGVRLQDRAFPKNTHTCTLLLMLSKEDARDCLARSRRLKDFSFPFSSSFISPSPAAPSSCKTLEERQQHLVNKIGYGTALHVTTDMAEQERSFPVMWLRLKMMADLSAFQPLYYHTDMAEQSNSLH